MTGLHTVAVSHGVESGTLGLTLRVAGPRQPLAPGEVRVVVKSRDLEENLSSSPDVATYSCKLALTGNSRAYRGVL